MIIPLSQKNSNKINPKKQKKFMTIRPRQSLNPPKINPKKQKFFSSFSSMRWKILKTSARFREGKKELGVYPN